MTCSWFDRTGLLTTNRNEHFFILPSCRRNVGIHSRLLFPPTRAMLLLRVPCSILEHENQQRANAYRLAKHLTRSSSRKKTADAPSRLLYICARPSSRVIGITTQRPLLHLNLTSPCEQGRHTRCSLNTALTQYAQAHYIQAHSIYNSLCRA
jgi:hypothetical protein